MKNIDTFPIKLQTPGGFPGSFPIIGPHRDHSFSSSLDISHCKKKKKVETSCLMCVELKIASLYSSCMRNLAKNVLFSKLFNTNANPSNMPHTILAAL